MSESMTIRSVVGVTAVAKTRLTPQQSAQVERLAQRDQEVRRHEAAHLAAAGSIARGGIALSYTLGPDGRLYATGGKVNIDLSAGSTPEATIAKARQIRAAATAPMDPSAQDLAVVAEANALETEARLRLAHAAASSPAA